MSASASSSTHATRPAAYASRSCVKSATAESAGHLRDEIASRLLVRVLVGGPASTGAGAGALAFSSVRAFFCAALVRAFSADRGQGVGAMGSIQAIDGGHGGIGVLAAQRHAFDLGGVGQPFDAPAGARRASAA